MTPLETPELRAFGLCLRPFSDTDASAFRSAALESVDTVGRWMPWCKNSYQESDALEWFAVFRAAASARSALEFGVFCANTGQLMGGAGLNKIAHDNRFCNLGYWIRQSHHRQGIATRCVQILSRHAFEVLGLQRLEIVVALGNHASEGVAIKSGALREGIARNRLCIREQAVSAHMFSLVPGTPVATLQST